MDWRNLQVPDGPGEEVLLIVCSVLFWLVLADIQNSSMKGEGGIVLWVF